MDVKLILPVGGIDGFPIPNDPGHDAEDLFVGDAILASETMVANNDVIIGTNLQDAVENVFIPAFVENGIVAFAAGGRVLTADFNDITALAEKGKHGKTDIGIDEITVFFEKLLEGAEFDGRLNRFHF